MPWMPMQGAERHTAFPATLNSRYLPGTDFAIRKYALEFTDTLRKMLT